MYVFSRDVQLQATVNTSCWNKAFVLNKYKRMIRGKFRASNTLLNSAEYAITRQEHFSFLA
jgi:hypothetical protein